MFHGAEDDPGYQPPRWCLVGTSRVATGGPTFICGPPNEKFQMDVIY